MISFTLRKLESLAPRTRDRKILALLAELRMRVGKEQPPSDDETRLLLGALGLSEATRSSLPVGPFSPTERDFARWQRALEAALGISSADWDLQAPRDRSEVGRQFPFAVYLEDLRSPFNVGSLLRTAEAYGFDEAILSPGCPALDHPRVVRTAMGAQGYLDVQTLTLDDLQAKYPDRPVMALELGGTPVGSFSFPPKGILMVGSEELGLSPEALALADASGGRVSLPLYGRKASLNVGVAFGVAAAAWTSAWS